MNKPQKESQRLASWLADAVMTEMAKPEDEIDVEFVESCENLLNTIMGEKKLTDEEIEVRVNKIMEKRSKPRSVPKKRKTAFIAIIAAVVFLISGIMVCATTPISQYILKTLDLGLNESVSDVGITYTYNGKNTFYDSIENFLEIEKINICYPEYLPYGSQIDQILRIENNNQTTININDLRITFKIYHNDKKSPEEYNYSDIIDYNNYSFYIFDMDNYSAAYFNIDSDFYVLTCDSKDELIRMIYGLNFERLN